MKTFVELCLGALEDTTMIILCISAAVSLLIGVVKGWPDNIMQELYEGIAILGAVTTIAAAAAAATSPAPWLGSPAAPGWHTLISMHLAWPHHVCAERVLSRT